MFAFSLFILSVFAARRGSIADAEINLLSFFFNVVRGLEKEDFLENSRILPCLVQLKSVLLNLLCVFDLFFRNAGSQICFTLKKKRKKNLLSAETLQLLSLHLQVWRYQNVDSVYASPAASNSPSNFYFSSSFKYFFSLSKLLLAHKVSCVINNEVDCHHLWFDERSFVPT